MRTANVAGTIFFAPDKELSDEQERAGIQGDKSAYIRGGIDFHLAECAALQDSDASWPFFERTTLAFWQFGRPKHRAKRHAAAWLRLDGFKYRLLSGPTLSWRERTEWLKMSRSAFATSAGSNKFSSLQPYEQLATVLKSQGFVHDASRILFRRGMLAWSPASTSKRGSDLGGQIIAFLLNPLINYFRKVSYFPHQGVIAIFVMIVSVNIISQDFYELGLMRPAEEEVIIGEDYANFGKVPLEMRFNSLAYTVDLIVPGLDFRQERYWMPKILISTGRRPMTPIATPDNITFKVNNNLSKSARNRITIYNNSYAPYFVEFFARVLGWIWFSVTILGYTGILRPDREV